MVEKEKKVEKEKPSRTFELVNVPTEHTVAVRNTETDEIEDMNKALVEMRNDIHDIKKAVA